MAEGKWRKCDFPNCSFFNVSNLLSIFKIFKMTFHCYLGFYLDSTLEMPFAVAAGFMAAVGTHIPSPERLPGARAIKRPVCLFSLASFPHCSSTETSFVSLMYSDWLLPRGLCTSIPLLQGSSLDLHGSCPSIPLHPPPPTHTYITTSHKPLFSSASFVLLVFVWVGFTKINLPCVFFADVLSILLPCRLWILSRLESWPSPFQPCTYNNAQHLMILV